MMKLLKIEPSHGPLKFKKICKSHKPSPIMTHGLTILF